VQDPPRYDVMALTISVKPEERAMYQMVAAAVESPVFDGTTTLAALWASLPQLPRLQAVTQDYPRWVLLTSARNPDMDALSNALRPTHGSFSGSRIEDITGDLAAYPTIERLVQVRVDERPIGRGQPVFTFPNEDRSLRSLSEIGDPLSDQPGRSNYSVRPRIGSGDGAPPSELLTFWALLFGFSNACSLLPGRWVRALNPDRADTAVPLEHGLDVSLEITSRLLFSGLGAGPRMRKLFPPTGIFALPTAQTDSGDENAGNDPPESLTRPTD
jgi:hypothetical protein